uniref:Uncharacterized protein n=3 Tax=viral metagenome TaxID=1070528 RepID=A0A6M3XCB4_9ZZZZ
MDSEWTKDDRRSIIEEVLAQREARRKADAQAEALAAEDTAVYNLDLIRKLEKRVEDLQARVGLNEYRDEAIQERVRRLEREIEEISRLGCGDLENVLADARRDHSDLVKLVERMGRDLDSHCMTGFAREYRYPYTITSQREYDAAMHEAEGAPEGHELVEDIQ